MGSRRLDTGGQQLSLRGYIARQWEDYQALQSQRRERRSQAPAAVALTGAKRAGSHHGQETAGPQRLRRGHSPAQGNQTQVSLPILLCCPDTGHAQRIPQPSWRGRPRTAETQRGLGPWNITYFFIFVFFFSRPRHAVYLSSQTRNQTCAPCIRECGVLITGLPGKFETFLIDKCSFPWCLIEKGCMRKDSSM